MKLQILAPEGDMKSKMQQALASFEGCNTYDELKNQLQYVAESYGFSGFNCLDIGNPQYNVPYYQGYSGYAWEEDHENIMYQVDPCLLRARRTDGPFSWSGVAVGAMKGKKKSKAMEMLEGSNHRMFNDGLVIPYHFLDPNGHVYNSLIIFSWKDGVSDFRSVMKASQVELHVIMVNWAQRAVDMVLDQTGQENASDI